MQHQIWGFLGARVQWRGNYFWTGGGKTKGCNAKYGSSENILGQGGKSSQVKLSLFTMKQTLR